MRIALASSGNTSEAVLDKSFGRCAFFGIFDTQDSSMVFIPNPNRDAEERAGSASVELLAGLGVRKIVSAEFGQKVKPLLDRLNIQMIIVHRPDTTVGSVIQLIVNQKP